LVFPTANIYLTYFGFPYKALRIDRDIAGAVTEQDLLSGGVLLGDAKRIMRVFVQLAVSTESKQPVVITVPPSTVQEELEMSLIDGNWTFDREYTQATTFAQSLARSNSSSQYCSNNQSSSSFNVGPPHSSDSDGTANRSRRVYNKVRNN
jgi:hypothetical protein